MKKPDSGKVGVGFSSLKLTKGAQAPISSVLFLFVAPEVSPFGSVRGETFGSAGLAFCSRSANPAHAATNLFSSGLWQWLFTLQKATIMPILIVRHAATLKELAEHARIHSAQTCALAETIHTLAADKDEFQDARHFIQVTSLIWLLLALLEQQEALCERIESLVFEGASA
jgi:hypothetical protein